MVAPEYQAQFQASMSCTPEGKEDSLQETAKNFHAIVVLRVAVISHLKRQNCSGFKYISENIQLGQWHV